jgi:hypothetical protein
MADAVTDTDLELMDFSTLFKDILLNRFDLILPPNITKVTRSDPSSESNSIKKPKPTETAVMVRNQNQMQEWKLRRDERWDTVFCNKSRQGPTLSIGSKPCLKYHAKGFCFDDCSLIRSHAELNEDDKKMTDNFIKELRGE